jgi:hypothetical protein
MMVGEEYKGTKTAISGIFMNNSPSGVTQTGG